MRKEQSKSSAWTRRGSVGFTGTPRRLFLSLAVLYASANNIHLLYARKRVVSTCFRDLGITAFPSSPFLFFLHPSSVFKVFFSEAEKIPL